GVSQTMQRPSVSVQHFFDSLSGDYSEKLERCVPRYREMLWALLEYLPRGASINSILELGCGTGNLSVVLAERFPESLLQMVDVSGNSLKACRARLGSSSRFGFEQRDFRDLSYDHTSFDLVISSISIHHLMSEEKRQLFDQIHRWLKDDGVFSYADQFAGATSDIYQRHIDNWQKEAFYAGATQAEWDLWMQHQSEHDHHEPLCDQIDWLKAAGFRIVDCPWRYLLWSIVQARKS
ncbi:MAG: class I SAM-dependent methyltransferase, partial [Planctomycetaceae bacterium]|nr:class I SAM-dependent methyltransferase [Planctomycetaceae bacterium]